MIGTKDFLRSIMVCTIASIGTYWKAYSCVLIFSLLNILLIIILSYFAYTASIVTLAISLSFTSMIFVGTLMAIVFLYYKLVFKETAMENTSITMDTNVDYADEGSILNVKFGIICGFCILSFFDTLAFFIILLTLII